MSEEAKFCNRCGCRLGREAVHLVVSPIDEEKSDPALISARDLCKDCGKSLSRWAERGSRKKSTPRKPRDTQTGRKNSSKRGKFRPTREQIGLGVVILLGLGFCYYMMNNYQ